MKILAERAEKQTIFERIADVTNFAESLVNKFARILVTKIGVLANMNRKFNAMSIFVSLFLNLINTPLSEINNQ